MLDIGYLKKHLAHGCKSNDKSNNKHQYLQKIKKNMYIISYVNAIYESYCKYMYMIFVYDILYITEP